MSWLKRCLESCGDYPVIVVDNASTDDTVTFIETQFPHVILLKQEENLGFGQANNIGIIYALNQGAEHVFLLNQDAYLMGNVLEKLVSLQTNYPEYGIVSPIHLNGKGNVLDYNFKNFVKRSKDFIGDVLLKEKHSNKNKLIEIEFVNAALWMVSKKCLKKVGGFNPYFFQYGEDRDYVNRVHYHGFKIGVVLDAFACHDRIQEDSVKKTKRIDTILYEVGLLNPLKNKKIDREVFKLRKQVLKNSLKLRFSRNKMIKQKLSVLNVSKLKYYSDLVSSKKEFLFLK